jgi:hypothetical protein
MLAVLVALRLVWVLGVTVSAADSISVSRFLDAARASTAASDYGKGTPQGCLHYSFTVAAGQNRTVFLTTAFGVDLGVAPPFALASSSGLFTLAYLYPNNAPAAPGAQSFYNLLGLALAGGEPVSSFAQCEYLSPAVSDLRHFMQSPGGVANGNRLLISCQAGTVNCSVVFSTFAGSVSLCSAVVEGVFDTLPPHWVLAGRAVVELLLVIAWRKACRPPRSCGASRVPDWCGCCSCTSRQDNRVHAYALDRAVKRQWPEIGRVIMWLRLLCLGASAVRLVVALGSRWSGWLAYNLLSMQLMKGAIMSTVLLPVFTRITHLVMSPALDKDPVTSKRLRHFDRSDVAAAAVAVFFVLAPVVTHVVPSLVAFPWIYLLGVLAAAVLAPLGWLLRQAGCSRRSTATPHAKSSEEDRLLAVMLVAGITLGTQYAVTCVGFLYDGLNYADVLKLDYALRGSGAYMGYFTHVPELFRTSSGTFWQDHLAYRLLLLA